MEQAQAVVEIKNVTKRFGDFVAVKQASLSLNKGQFLTIVGPSGCGKTTLLRMVAGFIDPSEGAIAIKGQPVADVPPAKRNIGMVFQRLALFPHLTAAQNIAYPLRMRRFDRAEIADRVAAYLRLVKLDDLGDRRPNELSGGQQQRVAIARALVFEPDLLLLDEPYSALDKKLREEMQLEFRRIQQELGVTTINVTHDQREALVMSDQIVVMNGGEIQQTDTPEDMYHVPANGFVARFIGMTSVLRGTAGPATASAREVCVGDATLLARGGQPLEIGQAVECAIRAEQIRILDDASDDFENRFEGVVAQRIFEGDRIVYSIRVPLLGDAELYVFDHDPLHNRRHAERAAITIGWHAADLFPFPTPET